MIEVLNNSDKEDNNSLHWACRSIRVGGEIQSIEGFRWNEIFLALVNFLAAMFSISFNSLVLYVFFKNKNLRGVTHILAVMLSTADILTAFCQMYTAFIQSYIAYRVENIRTDFFCKTLLVEIFMTLILMTVSITIIFGITCERYVAVLHPISYKTNKSTTFKGMSVILVLFAFSLVLGESRTSIEVGSAIFFLTIISTFSFCFYAYVRIYFKLKISKRVADFEILPNISRQKKRFITSLLVILVFLVCYFPIIVMGSAISVRSETNGSLSLYFQPWLRSFFYISSSANPFIYCLRNSRLSPIIMAYIKKGFGARRNGLEGHREGDAGLNY